MSGAGEGAAMLGLISGALTIIEAVQKVYDAAKNAEDIPKAFQEVALRLPLLRETLEIVEQQCNRDDFDDLASSEVLSSVRRIKKKLRKLETIFNKCIPTEDSSRFERYILALRTLGKDHKVEKLMKSLLETSQDIVNHHSIRAATADQVDRLGKALKDISALEPSVPDNVIEDPNISARNVHTGSGDLNTASGNARQFNARDNARHYHASTITIHD
ncbi:hypothetical protein PG988_007857 [Apiospora saccharicola]